MTVQIEEGKYYRTRVGDRRGPAKFDPRDDRYPWDLSDGKGHDVGYTHDGAWMWGHAGLSQDLVAEWADEPETAQPPSVGAHIADTAKSIVSGARRGAYGSPERNFERIARYWTAYFQNTGRDVTITASDVSPMMRFVKEARLNENPKHLDSFVDLVGYTLTGAETNGVDTPD